MSTFRYYQEEADNAIYNELSTNNKCIVKMFCGTGKSILMRKCKIIQDKNLVVYVFPSLSLIDQFNKKYLCDYPAECKLCISSKNDWSNPESTTKRSREGKSTTNPTEIIRFLANPMNKIICITYQSFNTLLENLGSSKISVCIFDEAHHAVGETYQKLIFENDACDKQIFFTATPKNANGIVMYNRENLEAGVCGKLVYDYSYLRGVNEGYLNPFEIRIDMFLENANKSVYESIARAILASGNNRVLTFHSDVNTGRDKSVKQFVNSAEFKRTFKEIQKSEFPKNKTYKDISMKVLDAKTKNRTEILEKFDATPDNEVIVISSCETIGEGIDTKNANMCVFVDPKSSNVKIIQNIGRVARKVFGVDKPNSTILIPCWVDKTKYLDCGGDREKCDEVIRQDMSADGNFNGILNVMSALKQEDEDLYDICLYYPDSFSPQEIESNLERHGYVVAEQVGDGGLIETLEHLLDGEIDYANYEDCESDREMILQIAEENGVCIEIHTNSLETPVERYNSECESGEVVRLYKSTTDEEVYCPIKQKATGVKRSRDAIRGPSRNNRFRANVHTNPDVKVLWNITSDIALTNDICSCVIDCEVVKYDPMEVAKSIVERAQKRVENKGGLLPRCIDAQKRSTPELEQENKDAVKLSCWKMALNGHSGWKCDVEVRDYLDKNLSGWRVKLDLNEKAMEDAKAIVERAQKRIEIKSNLLPRQIHNTTTRLLYSVLKHEHKDATKLGNWKQTLKEKGRGNCSNDVRDYLDTNLPGWCDERNFDKKAMEYAKSIVERAQKRVENKCSLLPRYITDKTNRLTPELEQEYKDATKLGNWKKALKGNRNSRCSDNVRNYLDANLPGWRDELDKKAMEYAKSIVERAQKRVENKGGLLPRCIDAQKRSTPELEQENKDAQKLGDWKKALKGKGHQTCSDDVRYYLDTNLPGWRPSINSDSQSESMLHKPTTKKKSMKLKTTTNAQPKETTEQKRQRVKSEISLLHQRYKRLTSQNLRKEFNDTPELWYKYHEIAEANEESFPEAEIPRNRIIQELNKFEISRTKLVVDMGCGKAQIARHFQNDSRFQFINYDHIASNDTVASCDIANTPLKAHSVEICILSLAMWGSNYHEYIQEAWRILESSGNLYIIEPTKRWSEKDEYKNIIPGKEGMELKTILEKNGFKIIDQSINKFCLFACVKS
jgi:superfamily II DNA or RNA helicase